MTTNNHSAAQILELSPINSSKSSDSNSFFSPRELNLIPITVLKPEKTRLSLNEKPSILMKPQPDPPETQCGFNSRFRASFLKDLEKKGYFMQKSKLSLGKSEASTVVAQESSSQSSGVEKKPGEVKKDDEQVNYLQINWELSDWGVFRNKLSGIWRRNYVKPKD